LRFFTNIKYFAPTNYLFGIKSYSDILEIEAKNRDIIVNKSQELIAIDGLNKQATFKSTENGETSIEDYDLLYVVPSLIPPDFIKKSSLADKNGFVDVDENTLQSKKYPNVFAIGDCMNTPNSKSFCSIVSQAPVVIHNLNQVMKNELPNAYYDGYSADIIILGTNKVLITEYIYNGKLDETFPKLPIIGSNGYIAQHLLYWLQTTGFPFIYWNLWCRGYINRKVSIKHDISAKK
jgi:sulfide:quinone oxidoreductase